MALTDRPLPAHSLEGAFVSCASPPLAALYAGTLSPPWNDRSEATLMMLPFFPEELGNCSGICAPTSRQRVNTAVDSLLEPAYKSLDVTSTYRIGGGPTSLIPIVDGKLVAGVSSLHARTVQQDIDPVPIPKDFRQEGRE